MISLQLPPFFLPRVTPTRAPGTGFGMHGHDDMEINTYLLGGKLEHEDSLGSGSIIVAATDAEVLLFDLS